MRRSAVAAAAILVALVASTAPARASWSGVPSAFTTGWSRATAVPVGPAAAATATGSTATVTWPAVTLPGGIAVGGYQVSRVDTVTSVASPAGGGCGGTVLLLTCSEASLPSGRWAYRVQAVRGNWTGSLGAQSATLTIDATAPVVAAATIQKSTGGLAGAIRQGGTYRIYANVADAGDPATGVSTVTANASSLTTGATAIPLTAGSFTVGGVTYGYRSAQLTASNPLAAGSKAFTVTATDGAGNSSGAASFSATVDNTVPTGADVQVTNGGGTVGRPEAGDRVVFTFSEAIDPEFVLAGWSGGSTGVTVRLTNNAGGDRLVIRNAANSANLPFGTVFLTNTGYVTTTRDFTASTMVMSGSTVVITLGTPSGATGTVTTASTSTWTPSSTVVDAAGNACSTTSVSESGGADVQF